MINFLKLTAYVLFMIGLSSCEKDKISGDVISDPELASDLYSKSVDTLSFQSNKYILEAQLYRDFFPGGPIQRKHALVASIYLVNIDSLPVSEDIEIKRLYVINDQQIWIASLKEGVQPNVPDFKLEKLNNSGPEWETGIVVDVIIEIESKSTTDLFYLIAKDQKIVRTE
jgi:Uma2 family endonuclease